MYTVKQFKYCYLTIIILLKINDWYTVKRFKYCYLTIKILLKINDLYTVKTITSIAI